MKPVIHYVGLDVHKETIAVSLAPQNTTEVRRYGIIGGTLDAVDKLLKKLSVANVERSDGCIHLHQRLNLDQCRQMRCGAS